MLPWFGNASCGIRAKLLRMIILVVALSLIKISEGTLKAKA